MAISPNAESVTLAANRVHLLAPHVSPSPDVEPQLELSSPILETAPAQAVRAGAVRDVVSPHASNVERNELVIVSAV